MPKFRYKIIIEYEGTNYSGWAVQKNIKYNSIQGVLETAIKNLTLEHGIRIYGAGRTDAGVHALGQVAHFDLSKSWLPYKLQQGINHFLINENIVVLSCEEVNENFHARFSAIYRHYLYRIIHSRKHGILHKQRAWCIEEFLDAQLMQDAAQILLGKHDFTSFRSSSCQAISPIRSIDTINIYTNVHDIHTTQDVLPKKCDINNTNTEIMIHIKARSFLHNQVRIIVGQLREVGAKRCSKAQVELILDARDRTKASVTAPAHGLYLCNIEY